MPDKSNPDSRGPHAIIPKEKMSVVCMTEQFRIEGTTHYVSDARLSDLMNRMDLPFLPITNATAYSHDGHLIMKSAFIALNKAHVVFITTQECDEAGGH